jgi:hypothetical protein
VITKTGAEAPGRVCRDSGGIFVLNQACSNTPPAGLEFSTYSGHYVSPLVINFADGTFEQVPVTDIRSRTWRATELVDAAIDWVQQQPANQPWMAALSFSLAHTPFHAAAESNPAEHGARLEQSGVLIRQQRFHNRRRLQLRLQKYY